MLNRIIQIFELLLWRSRLIILVAVIASIVSAIAALIMATAEVIHMLTAVGSFVRAMGHADPGMSERILTMMVRSVDGYLLTSILIIFALGLYELFIGKIEAAEQSDVAARVLLIRSLDDLKDRLAKVVILILVIEFFQHAVEMHFTTMTDLLGLAFGTLMVSGAIYLSSRSSKHAPDNAAVLPDNASDH